MQMTNPLPPNLSSAPTNNPAAHAPLIWPSNNASQNNAPPNNMQPFLYGNHQGCEPLPQPGSYLHPHYHPHYNPNAYPPQQPPFHLHMPFPYPSYNYGGHQVGPPPPGHDYMVPPYAGGYPGGFSTTAITQLPNMMYPHPGQHHHQNHFDANPNQQYDATDNKEEKNYYRC